MGRAARLWADPGVRASLALADLKGSYLFESRPDLFPERRLTDDELELWGMYYQDKGARQ